MGHVIERPRRPPMHNLNRKQVALARTYLLGKIVHIKKALGGRRPLRTAPELAAVEPKPVGAIRADAHALEIVRMHRFEHTAK